MECLPLLGQEDFLLLGMSLEDVSTILQAITKLQLAPMPGPKPFFKKSAVKSDRVPLTGES